MKRVWAFLTRPSLSPIEVIVIIVVGGIVETVFGL